MIILEAIFWLLVIIAAAIGLLMLALVIALIIRGLRK